MIYIQVDLLREMRYTWQQVADVLMISRTTLWRRLTELRVPLASYSDISEHELDGVMQLLVRDFPRNGVVMMWGQLRSMNIFVSRQKVHDSLMRVSPLYVQQRRSSTISRRVYNVPAPNCLWHIDGLHCLIRWKIIIHGGIDGFSRRIIYLRASSNNRADTVLNLFQGTVMECGWPSRVRSDLQASVQAVWLDMGTDDHIEDAVSFQQCNSFLQMVVLQSMVSFKTSGGV